MWKWIAVGVVLIGGLLCAGAAGGAGWWWWAQERAHAAMEQVAVLADAEAMTVMASEEAEQDRIQERLAEGRAAATASEHADAVAAFSDVLEQSPEQPEALLGRGHAYAWLERYDLAEADLRLATRLAPTDPDGWETLGWVLGRMGNDREAVDAFDRLVALDESDGKAWRTRANARYRLGDVTGARADAAKACALGLPEGCALEERIKSATRR